MVVDDIAEKHGRVVACSAPTTIVHAVQLLREGRARKPWTPPAGHPHHVTICFPGSSHRVRSFSLGVCSDTQTWPKEVTVSVSRDGRRFMRHGKVAAPNPSEVTALRPGDPATHAGLMPVGSWVPRAAPLFFAGPPDLLFPLDPPVLLSRTPFLRLEFVPRGSSRLAIVRIGAYVEPVAELNGAMGFTLALVGDNDEEEEEKEEEEGCKENRASQSSAIGDKENDLDLGLDLDMDLSFPQLPEVGKGAGPKDAGRIGACEAAIGDLVRTCAALAHKLDDCVNSINGKVDSIKSGAAHPKGGVQRPIRTTTTVARDMGGNGRHRNTYHSDDDEDDDPYNIITQHAKDKGYQSAGSTISPRRLIPTDRPSSYCFACTGDRGDGVPSASSKMPRQSRPDRAQNKAKARSRSQSLGRKSRAERRRSPPPSNPSSRDAVQTVWHLREPPLPVYLGDDTQRGDPHQGKKPTVPMQRFVNATRAEVGSPASESSQEDPLERFERITAEINARLEKAMTS